MTVRLFLVAIGLLILVTWTLARADPPPCDEPLATTVKNWCIMRCDKSPYPTPAPNPQVGVSCVCKLRVAIVESPECQVALDAQ